MTRRDDPLLWAIAVGAVAVTIVSFWLPIFRVGGFVYTMIDSYGGRAQFVAAVALPVVLGLGALAVARRQVWPAALAGAVMATLAPVEHLGEAAWKREHPERLGAPFEFGVGFVVAFAGIIAGAVIFVALVRFQLSASVDEHRDRWTDGVRVVAVLGLLIAIVGQLAESSKAHLWQLPRWPQVGRWWELIVTTACCGLALWRRGVGPLGSGALVAVVAAASSAQQLRAVASLEDDPAMSTTVTLAGFTVVALALIITLVGSLHRR